MPLYEEHARLPHFGPALLRFVAGQPKGSELILVDDGSSDDTLRHARALASGGTDTPVRVLARPRLGKGAAIRAGLEVATGEVAAFCDVDLATPLDDLQRLIELADAAQVVAIGSRDLPGSVLVRRESAAREFLGRAYNRAVQLAVLPGIVDSQCGAKAAPTAVWRRLLPHSTENGFAWDVEVLAIARALQVRVQEVPVTWRHEPGSRVHVLRDGTRMVAALRRIRRAVAKVRVEPELAVASTPEGIFTGSNVEALAEADATHWWFRSKAAYVSWALRRNTRADGWLVDVGGGAGGVTALLGWAPERTLVLDGSEVLTERAANRHGLCAATGEVTRLPLATASAAVVCLLDVVEHLPDPVGALREARRVLTPDGVLVVTVPAHPWLWSAADVQLGHQLRYTRRALHRQVQLAELEPTWMGHVFSWLVPPVWLRRRLSRNEPQLGLDVSSPVIDAAALVLTRVERATMRLLQMPFGTSILCIARPGPSTASVSEMSGPQAEIGARA